MSDTPRTDAAVREVDVAFVGHWGLASEPQEFVPPEFARELERENAALREAFAKADVMYEYRRDDGQRQWVTFSMWIHKGQIVVLMDTAALVAARAKEGQP